MVAVLAVGLTACSEIIDAGIGGIDGSGTAATETRDVGSFDTVAVEGSGTVIIDIGPSASLTIEADDNLLAHLTSEVDGGALVLSSDVSVDPKVPIVYRITVPELAGIEVSGSADVRAAPISGERFTVAISGSGDVEASEVDATSVDVSISGSGSVTLVGAAGTLAAAVSGSGDVRAADLAVETAQVDIAGSGGVEVDASLRLTGSISGSGDIEYLGEPSVDVSETGSGRVSRR